MEPVSTGVPDWLGPLVFVTGALCSLVLAVISGVRTARFLKRSVETSGEVVRLQKAISTMFYQRFGAAPVFRFRAEDGRTHTVTSKFYTNPSRFEAGDRVLVRYDRTNPENARIATLFQIWGGTIIWGSSFAIAMVVIMMDARAFVR